MFYGTPPYNEYLKAQLAKLTLADVNRVIKQYIRTDRLVIAAVTKNGEELKQATGERRCLADDLQFAEAGGDHRRRQGGG